MKVRTFVAAGLALAVFTITAFVRADEVSDWNENTFTAIFTAKTSPLISTRVTAMVQSAVFDAVNGVFRRYTPVHVPADAPRGASARAAVVQAAYGVLVRLFPAQQATLDDQLAASLASLDDDEDGVSGQSVERGLAWGQDVADQIWAWRSADGFTPAPPPYLGSDAIGKWRPTPPGFLSGAGPQFAYLTPWAISSQSQFRPGGPPALTSSQYATDFNEIKVMGSATSAARSADQTLFSVFWNGNTPGFWNRTAVQVAQARDLSLLEKAHVLAAMNIAMADAIICCWEAKYTYEFWRPITAIPFADLDGNDATSADSTWTPLLITPNHPEYPSGHSTASGASAEVLAAFFGDATSFSVTSELTPGVTRYYTSFSGAVDEVRDARVFGGIHFRSACVDGQNMGRRVAHFVLDNSLQSVRGNGE
jgi:hypothetical protein